MAAKIGRLRAPSIAARAPAAMGHPRRRPAADIVVGARQSARARRLVEVPRTGRARRATGRVRASRPSPEAARTPAPAAVERVAASRVVVSQVVAPRVAAAARAAAVAAPPGPAEGGPLAAPGEARSPVRIVGGAWRGRRLAEPRTAAIRPTSDRLRESLFNVLAHAYDDAVAGARVLDLFAGTGALGFEALSRGATCALFVDDGAEARSVIRTNVEALGAEGVTRLFRRDAARLGQASAAGRFSLVFCDPPYGRDLAPAALAGAASGGWLAAGALAVVEEAETVQLAWPAGFVELERRSHGDTALTFGRYEG